MLTPYPQPTTLARSRSRAALKRTSPRVQPATVSCLLLTLLNWDALSRVLTRQAVRVNFSARTVRRERPWEMAVSQFQTLLRQADTLPLWIPLPALVDQRRRAQLSLLWTT